MAAAKFRDAHHMEPARIRSNGGRDGGRFLRDVVRLRGFSTSPCVAAPSIAHHRFWLL